MWAGALNTQVGGGAKCSGHSDSRREWERKTNDTGNRVDGSYHLANYG